MISVLSFIENMLKFKALAIISSPSNVRFFNSESAETDDLTHSYQNPRGPPVKGGELQREDSAKGTS